MSRIGKKPVAIPDGVTATVDGQTVTAKGPKGELKFVVNDEVAGFAMEDGAVSVVSRATSRRTPAPSGACRAP
jgi:large subunit ribosomal protein L6